MYMHVYVVLLWAWPRPTIDCTSWKPSPSSSLRECAHIYMTLDSHIHIYTYIKQYIHIYIYTYTYDVPTIYIYIYIYIYSYICIVLGVVGSTHGHVSALQSANQSETTRRQHGVHWIRCMHSLAQEGHVKAQQTKIIKECVYTSPPKSPHSVVYTPQWEITSGGCIHPHS